MGKIILCALVIIGLGVGEDGLLRTVIKPSSLYGYYRQGIQENPQLQPLSFYTSYNRPSFNTFIPNVLIIQTEGETLQPKTSFWKQAGIYGLEFVGAAMGSVVSVCCGDLFAGSWLGSSDYSLTRGFVVYSIINTLFTSSCTWGLGKLLGQKGTWWKTAVGSGIGALTGFTSAYLSRKKGEFTEVGIVFLLTAPAIGAVLGYNKK